MSVIVLAEGSPSLELIEEARTVARALSVPLVVYVAGAPAGAAPPTVKDGSEGDRLVAVSGLDSFSADSWLATFASVLGKQELHLVTMADTAHARAFFPALAARLRKPLLSGATRVRVLPPSHHHSHLHLEIERPLHGGLQTERLLVAAPLFVTLVASPATGAAHAAGHLHHLRDPPSDGHTAAASEDRERRARDRRRAAAARHSAGARPGSPACSPPSADTVDIRSADRIVAGGFGLGSKEGRRHPPASSPSCSTPRSAARASSAIAAGSPTSATSAPPARPSPPSSTSPSASAAPASTSSA